MKTEFDRLNELNQEITAFKKAGRQLKLFISQTLQAFPLTKYRYNELKKGGLI